jgi:hypothetical protein
MNYLYAHQHFCNKNLSEQDRESWPAIVDLIFEIVTHRDRLALKRKARGRQKRRLARRHKRGAVR